MTSHPRRPLFVGLLFVAVASGCASHRAKPGRAAPAGPGDSVTVGYGKRAKSELTGSVGSVSSRDVEAQRVARVEELIRGRVPGVEVLPTASGGYTIRVRGAARLTPGSSEPLLVIDGMQVNPSFVPSALAGIAPSDVERIDVLKDAGELAIYGSQGANGVILITTKRRR